jgi:FkbH-like protein
MRRAELLPNDVLARLGSLVSAVGAAEAAATPWRETVDIHFLRNFTIESLEPYLKFHLLREDIRANISFGGYETMAQEVLDPDSQLNQTRPEIVVLSLLMDFLDPESRSTSWVVETARERLHDLLVDLKERTTALVVINSLLPPIDLLLSHGTDALSDPRLVALNEYLSETVNTNPERFVLIDWQAYLPPGAIANTIDVRFWKTSQAPFKASFLNCYAKDIAKYVRALKGLSKKCLVLDCDNTLWGGVVGEDGIDGILLDPENGPGKVYFEFQQAIMQLHSKGVLIALCSKNNEQDVWQVLDSHPNCLLKKKHLAAWQINWRNKAENISLISSELNIGIDSLVFVDDSPQECALVLDQLPEVTVIQFSNKDANISNLLTRDGLFETLAQSDEDKNRTQMYRDQRQRKSARPKSGDLTAYLKSLATNVRIRICREDELVRVAQLTQKTNQFNLTTRRYSSPEIREFWSDSDAAVFSMSVSDRFGDLGLTGVLIARRTGSTGIVDTFLLSCRVLGRGLEFAFIDQCLTHLERIWKVDAWKAEYIATKKNPQVSDFWDRVGFELVDSNPTSKQYMATLAGRPNDYSNIITVHTE